MYNTNMTAKSHKNHIRKFNQRVLFKMKLKSFIKELVLSLLEGLLLLSAILLIIHLGW